MVLYLEWLTLIEALSFLIEIESGNKRISSKKAKLMKKFKKLSLILIFVRRVFSFGKYERN